MDADHLFLSDNIQYIMYCISIRVAISAFQYGAVRVSIAAAKILDFFLRTSSAVYIHII
jgi:hypothetical protein